MNLGILIIIISLLSYLSNHINNKYLNHLSIKYFYYLGIIIHESSHALMCFSTGAKIIKFEIFSRQPKVTHYKSKIPILGQTLISLAPLIGGFAFLCLINNYVLKGCININTPTNLKELLALPFSILSQINILEWKSWIVIILSLNIGAMLGPSFQDLKNIWWVFIILFFIKWPFLINTGLIIIALIITNIIIQISFILISKIIKPAS